MTKNDELEQLAQQCQVLIKAMQAVGIEDSFVKASEAALATVVAKKQARPFKVMLRDLNEWARGLDPHDKSVVDALLSEEQKRASELALESDAKTLQAIMARAKILTDEELAIARARMEEIYAEPSPAKEAEKLDSIITAYETKLR